MADRDSDVFVYAEVCLNFKIYSSSQLIRSNRVAFPILEEKMSTENAELGRIRPLRRTSVRDYLATATAPQDIRQLLPIRAFRLMRSYIQLCRDTLFQLPSYRVRAYISATHD